MKFILLLIGFSLIAFTNYNPVADTNTTTGTITGKVLYKGGKVFSFLNVIKDERTCGGHDLVDQSLQTGPTGELQWAVVSIEGGVPGQNDNRSLPGEQVLDQKGCTFQPHVLIATKGQEVTINNLDPTLHNVRTVSFMNDVFNKVQIHIPNQPAPSDKIIFEETEVVEIVCDVHGWMKAHVHVVDHPFYQITTDDGSFEFPDLPPGEYTLSVWHEKLGTQQQKIKVKAGSPAEVTFEYDKVDH